METQNHADLLPETYTAKVSESVTTIEVASSPASDSLAVGEVESSDTPNSIQSVQKNASVKINGNHASQSHVTLSDGHDVRTAIEVLQLIETYGSQYRGVGGQWHGLTSYVSVVSEQIKANEPVRLLFSGLDIKTSLALGKMPDLGEKLALAHLNGLCSNISAIYKTGAEVHICLRGFLFNDLLGVPDETVWRYEAGLRHIVASCELKYLHFVQFNELLQFEPSTWTKEHVLAHVDNYRRELVNKYTSSSAESDEHYVSQKYPLPDYVIRGLSHVNEEERGELLKLAQGRSLAYHVAVSTAKPDSLSLEAALYSAVTAPVDSVLIITLFPQGNSDAHFVSWDSVIAIERNGRYRSTTLSEVQDDTTYELIVDESGTPSHYRAKDSMWDWTADGLEVTFEHLYPTGTIIRPSASYAGKPPSITTLPMRKIRSLAQRFSPIVLRGFDETTNEDHFLMKGNELGEVLTWTFGQILKVKDSGEVDKNANNVTSNEAMPMHFDGIFKFIDRVDPISGEVKNVLTPPRYQYFTCLSTAPKGDGYTLFANSCLFFEALPAPFSLGRLEKVTWSMVNDGFWSAKQTELPLVVRHEETGAACLRWHEPWTQTKFSKYYFEIENDDAAEKLKAVINKLLYDYRICLRFEWEQGDLLINDNVSMLHTRTAFAGSCEREMWRIHFD